MPKRRVSQQQSKAKRRAASSSEEEESNSTSSSSSSIPERSDDNLPLGSGERAEKYLDKHAPGWRTDMTFDLSDEWLKRLKKKLPHSGEFTICTECRRVDDEDYRERCCRWCEALYCYECIMNLWPIDDEDEEDLCGKCSAT